MRLSDAAKDGVCNLMSGSLVSAAANVCEKTNTLTVAGLQMFRIILDGILGHGRVAMAHATPASATPGDAMAKQRRLPA